VQKGKLNAEGKFMTDAPDKEELSPDLPASQLHEREPAPCETGACHLNELANGEMAVVRHLDGGAHFRSRMASLGFTPGALVKMLQNYGHGAVIVSLRGVRVALGQGEAHKVGIARRTEPGQPGW
jgi:ferrous iron transport protein A